MECNSDDTYLKEKTTSMSWMIPTLMGWCVILKKEKGYRSLLTGIKESYTKICSQLWHPTNDLYKHLYFHPAQSFTGETEAPITFSDSMSDYKNRIDELRENERYNIFKDSSAVQAGLTILDFIACRHFRTPVPSVLWYGMQKNRVITDIFCILYHFSPMGSILKPIGTFEKYLLIHDVPSLFFTKEF
jgi:hypothetical protein